MAPDPAGVGPVIANAFCNFIIQLEYPGEVVGRLYLGDRGAPASTPSSRSSVPTGRA